MLFTRMLPVIPSPELWREVAARLRPFLARQVPPADVDDVLQDVFVRLQRGLSTLRDDERFTAWLFQVARSAVSEHARRRARHPVAPLADVEQTAPPADDDRDGAPSLSACVSLFVAQLADPYRAAVTLVELDGLTVREAAARVGVSATAMKSRVQRGRGQLRELLIRCCEIALDARGKVVDVSPRRARCPSCG